MSVNLNNSASQEQRQAYLGYAETQSVMGEANNRKSIVTKVVYSFCTILLVTISATMSVWATPTKFDVYSDLPTTSHPSGQSNATMGEMDAYISTLLNIGKSISQAKMTELKGLDRMLQNVNVQWNIYTQVRQQDIVENEILMDKFTAFQVTFQVVSDSIAAQKARLQAMEDITRAEKLLESKRHQYSQYLSESQRLSLTAKTAPLLQQLQAKEQIAFAELQQTFQQATQAALLVPSLKNRMDSLSQLFAEIKAQSDKVQQAKYVPLMQHLKDSLMSLAAVAIILMFVSMMKSKYAALKAAKKAAKQYKSMTQFNDNEYPTI
ncbi:MAG: hypothetical protein Q4E55_03435 [Bacteroidales bacterium]|nr:hypothetical protein [Bacteroidales bacterium]